MGGGKSVECVSALCVIVCLWVSSYLSLRAMGFKSSEKKSHIVHKFVNRAVEKGFPEA